MNSIISLLTKTLVQEFYRQNSGFFLLLATLTFGFMSGVEHRALAQFFISLPQTLLIPISVWFLYTIKILTFNMSQVTLPQNAILFHIPFLSKSAQWFCICVTFVLQFMPALLYGIFLGLIAWDAGAYQSLGMIFIALWIYCIAGTALLLPIFRKRAAEQKVSRLKSFLDRNFRKPLFLFYTEWLLRQYPLSVAGTKTLCAGFIFAVCSLYETESFDWRLMAMALSVCGMANLIIILRLQAFEHIHISWIKNLPVPAIKRFTLMMLVLTVFLIPESVIISRYCPDNLKWMWLFVCLFYYYSVVAFFSGFVLTPHATIEKMTRRSFWIFAVLIVLILFKTHPFLLGVVLLSTGYAFFTRNYYRFEPFRGK